MIQVEWRPLFVCLNWLFGFLSCDLTKVLTTLDMLDAESPISGQMLAKYRRTRGIQRTWDAEWAASRGAFRPKITHSIALK